MRPHVIHWLEHYLRADVAELLAPSWFMCVGFAGLVTLIVMLALARRRGIDSGTVASAVLWCYVAAVTAGIVVPMLIVGVEQLVATGRFHLRWAGMTSFWGYLAGAGAVVAVCKRDGVALGRMSDLSVIPLGVALVFARLGCFMAGCDYGKVSSLPWAVRFPPGSPAWRDHVHAGLIPVDRASSLPVHPTELYEAVLGLVIIAVAIVAVRRPRKDGQLFLIAAATYAIGRLIIETLRGDAGRGIYAGLSSGQIFSLLVLLAIAAPLVVRRRRALTVIAATALVLAVGEVGAAHAQPASQLHPFGPPPPPPPPLQDPSGPPPPPPLQDPSDSSPAPQVPPPADTPPEPDQPDERAPQALPDPPDEPPVAGPAEPLLDRPRFAIGGLFGVSTPLNRRAGQIPTLAGASFSFGYTPGWFGVWLDFDRYANGDALHSTVMASCSFARRITRHLTLGARSGIGLTRVNFDNPAFPDVVAKTVRLEALAEYALAPNWGVWVRPLTIDMLDASALGGPITTYQFRIGVAYRFGSRGKARPAAPPIPELPAIDPDPQPAPTTAARETP